MSEQTAVAENAPAPEAKPVDPMVQMVMTTVTEQVNKANALVKTINENTTDKGKLVHDIRTDENVTDDKVREFQKWFAQAEAAIAKRVSEIDEHIKANLLPKSEDVDVEALKVQHKALKDSVKAALTFVQSIPAYDPETFKVPDLANLRGGTSAGTGQGGKRPRLNRIWVNLDGSEGNGTLISKDTKNAKGEDVTVSNFTLAAAHIGKATKSKVEVKDLQAAAFAAAKTDDLSTLGGSVFDYYFEAGTDANRKNVKVTVEPKGDEDSSDDSSEETTPEAETPADTETTPAE
jgi:hypothetical protein